MNWRWIVPAAFGLGCLELFMGISAYGSKTWNLGHTAVLTGWPAVREVCLVFTPLILAGLVIFSALFMATLDWAMRGRR